MINVIIPLAGSSDIFEKAGYIYPKPLIQIGNELMIEKIVNSISFEGEEFKFHFIIKEEDATKYYLDKTLKHLSKDVNVKIVKGNTKGALCSILLLIDDIDFGEEVLILNGDQLLEIDHSSIYKFWQNKNSDFGVVTFYSTHPRWSYILVENEEVIEAAEKNPISTNAIAGYYYFKNAEQLFESGFKVILNNQHVSNIFYISSCINYLILEGKNVTFYKVDGSKIHPFYSPQLISDFERKLGKNEG